MSGLIKGIRRRRGAIRRRRVYLLLTAVKAVVFFTLLSGIGYAFYQYVGESPRFLVRSIRVEGATVLSPEAIRAAAGVTAVDNLLMFDAERIRKRVEAMPYVRNCQVERGYPDQVIIRVEERAPEATILVHNCGFEVDSDGMVLRELDGFGPHTGPLITNVADVGFVEVGSRLDNPALKAALDVWHAFSNVPVSNQMKLSEIVARSPSDLSMFCDDVPFEIKWGRTDFEGQAKRLDILWREKGGKLGCKEYLDLRFDNDVVCK
jgi:cell division protein FtsQ